MIYPTMNENHQSLHCPNCGSAWFRPTGFARVTLCYNAEDRTWIDDVSVDESESAPMHTTAVACMECGHDCTAIVAGAFGPMHDPPQPQPGTSCAHDDVPEA